MHSWSLFDLGSSDSFVSCSSGSKSPPSSMCFWLRMFDDKLQMAMAPMRCVR